MQFINLKDQYKLYKKEIDTAISEVLATNQYVMGSQVLSFEKKLSKFTGARYAITCSSGTDALLLALLALDIQIGDEVIVPAFSFFATAEVVSLIGATPVFVDIDEHNYNIDVKKINECITNKTKAIIAVSLYGQCADFDQISKYNVPVIEDAAQSFGAIYRGKKSCNLTNIGCTSFFPAKPLGAYGDGGAVFTNDSKIADKIKALLNHGSTRRYEHHYIGINGRLDTIQAAILNVKLKYFNNELLEREKKANFYTKSLEPLTQKYNVSLPIKEKYTDIHVYAQYTIQLDQREEIIEKLHQKGIPIAIHYPTPINEQKVYQKKNIKKNTPSASKISKRVLSLPICGFLKKNDQEKIINELLAILK